MDNGAYEIRAMAMDHAPKRGCEWQAILHRQVLAELAVAPAELGVDMLHLGTWVREYRASSG